TLFRSLLDRPKPSPRTGVMKSSTDGISLASRADIVNFQHDPLACAVALGWEGATAETIPLAFEMDGDWLRGRVDGGGRALRVVTAVEGRRFNAFWHDSVIAGRAPIV